MSSFNTYAKVGVSTRSYLRTEHDFERAREEAEKEILRIKNLIFAKICATPKDVYLTDDNDSTSLITRMSEEFEELWEYLEEYKYDAIVASLLLDEYRYGDGEMKTQFDKEVEDEKNAQKKHDEMIKEMRKLGMNPSNLGDIEKYQKMKDPNYLTYEEAVEMLKKEMKEKLSNPE